MKRKKHILVAPLCWGLGHASRCIPIIRILLEYEHLNVFLASDGEALALLKAEFPTLETITLPAYNVRYVSDNMLKNIAPQVPHLLQVIQEERRALKHIVSKYKIDALISDNRYGLYHKDIYTVFLTHQLNIKMPYRFLTKSFAWLNRFFIKKYDACWVPDNQDVPNLAGELSHGHAWANVRYIGVLSRLKRMRVEQIWDIVIVLSGPEPQRTYLEEKLLEQALALTSLRIAIIRGKPLPQPPQQAAPHIQMYNLLTSEVINRMLLEAKMVVMRSGYSSLMDIVSLGLDNVVLIPTPGQTEQEYLAEQLSKDGYYMTQTQSKVDLATIWKKQGLLKGLYLERQEILLKTAIDDMLAAVSRMKN